MDAGAAAYPRTSGPNDAALNSRATVRCSAWLRRVPERSVWLYSFALRFIREGIIGNPVSDLEHADDIRSLPKESLKRRALVLYGRVLDAIVSALVVVMLLALMGALAGLVIDFIAAGYAFSGALSSHSLVHGVVDGIDRELVIDVLSVFVLIELFRTFTDYLEFHRVRLRVLAEVGIAFILREVFIGLYDHSMDWSKILAVAALLAVLVTARIAAVQFQPPVNAKE
jgi:uncharacterized membrane protein (DUF373 family)